MSRTKQTSLGSQETMKKYSDYLKTLKKCSSFNLIMIRKEWKIGASINIWLIKNGVIEPIGGGEYTWVNRQQIDDSKMLPLYFEYYRNYAKKCYMKRKAKRNRLKNKQLKQSTTTVSVDKLMAKNFQRDIDKIKNVDAKRQREIWTDEDAISFLKQSPLYTYEIYRVTKQQI